MKKSAITSGTTQYVYFSNAVLTPSRTLTTLNGDEDFGPNVKITRNSFICHLL